MVALGLPPDSLGLGLNARHWTEHGHSTIEHAQTALHLGRKVNVAGRVDDVDVVPFHSQAVAAEVMVIPRSCSM